MTLENLLENMLGNTLENMLEEELVIHWVCNSVFELLNLCMLPIVLFFLIFCVRFVLFVIFCVIFVFLLREKLSKNKIAKTTRNKTKHGVTIQQN